MIRRANEPRKEYAQAGEMESANMLSAAGPAVDDGAGKGIDVTTCLVSGMLSCRVVEATLLADARQETTS